MHACPQCHSQVVVKNGHIHNGKQRYRCNDCGRQFVEDPQHQPVSDETKGLIDRLLLEKIPLAGIARVVGVSASWLQNYVNQKYRDTPRQVAVEKKGGL